MHGFPKNVEKGCKVRVDKKRRDISLDLMRSIIDLETNASLEMLSLGMAVARAITPKKNQLQQLNELYRRARLFDLERLFE